MKMHHQNETPSLNDVSTDGSREYLARRPLTLNWCEEMQNNKPQTNCIAGGNAKTLILPNCILMECLFPLGLLFMLVSGLHIGWGLWTSTDNTKWSDGISDGLAAFVICSWYVAAIFGSILGTILLPLWRRSNIYVSKTFYISLVQRLVAIK